MDDLRLASLAFLLVVAAVTDLRSQRIPNWLVAAGVINATGWTLVPGTTLDFTQFLEGLAVGLLVFLPLYGMRAVAAGDVKLMAMVGAYLGMRGEIGAILFTVLAGGVLAISIAARTGVLRQMFRNIGGVLRGSIAGLACGTLPSAEVGAPAARMPYGVAIAVGTIAFLIWQRI
jgi:prepilin peptidase CpaA